MTTRKAGLGRNLNMLLNNTAAVKTKSESDNAIMQLEVDVLQPGAYQPRRAMSEEGLKELSESIKKQGLLQPLVVRAIANNRYEIIAGERRYQASKIAGLKKIPVIIHQVDDKTSLAMALVENIQRENLNPMDEARALSRLVEEFDLTHQQAADIVSKARASVSNLLRLIHLHTDVQLFLEHGDIEMGHARALLGLPMSEQVVVAKEVVAKGLTVRDVEALIKQTLHGKKTPIMQDKALMSEAKIRQKTLSKQLNVSVNIKTNKQGKLNVVLQYDSLKQLDALIEKITR